MADALDGGSPIVFHGSDIGGLTSLEPRISSHGQAWVYATRQRSMAMIFMQRWNDFIFNLAWGDDGLLELTERFPGAFERIFVGKGGFLYHLDGSTFQQDQTRFSGEVVSSLPAAVLGCEHITDVGTSLMACEGTEIRIRRYPDRHPDLPADDADLLEEARRMIAAGRQDDVDACLACHPHLQAALASS